MMVLFVNAFLYFKGEWEGLKFIFGFYLLGDRKGDIE